MKVICFECWVCRLWIFSVLVVFLLMMWCNCVLVWGFMFVFIRLLMLLLSRFQLFQRILSVISSVSSGLRMCQLVKWVRIILIRMFMFVIMLFIICLLLVISVGLWFVCLMWRRMFVYIRLMMLVFMLMFSFSQGVFIVWGCESLGIVICRIFSVVSMISMFLIIVLRYLVLVCLQGCEVLVGWVVIYSVSSVLFVDIMLMMFLSVLENSVILLVRW